MIKLCYCLISLILCCSSTSSHSQTTVEPKGHLDTSGRLPLPVLIQEQGKASWYDLKLQRMANGQRFSPKLFIAAHPSAPMGTQLTVSLCNGSKTVIVAVRDRGPFVKGRIVDLSPVAFERLAPLNQGVIDCVKVRWVK